MPKNKGGEFKQNAGTIFVFEAEQKSDKSPQYRGTAIVEIPEDYEPETVVNADGDEVQAIRAVVQLWTGESANGEMLSGRVIEQATYEAQLEEFKSKSGTDFKFGANKKSGGKAASAAKRRGSKKR